MGDLISREAAVQMLMEKSYGYVVSLFPTSDECNTAREIAKECAEAVRQMEVVDAVEVVRCKDCIYRKKPLKCPMCNGMPYKDPFGRHFLLTQDKTTDDGFCHCGAKMDGEKNEL